MAERPPARQSCATISTVQGFGAPPFFQAFGGDLPDGLDGCVDQAGNGEFEAFTGHDYSP
jgi:hypothetical protein